MEMINRYIYAVTKRLPEKARADVARELRASVEDMLPDGYSENDVRDVLNKLGNPATLADEYREGKQYLIGPGMYDSYLAVLKIVETVVITVVTIATLAGYFVGLAPNATLVEIFLGALIATIGAIVSAVVQVFAWVTLTFFLLERSGVGGAQLPFSKGQWSLDDLEPVPDGRVRLISRMEVALEMIWMAFWAAILVFAPASIGWYRVDGGRLTGIVPLLNAQVFHSYLPAVIAVIIVGLLDAILKLVYGRWNILLATVNAANNLLFLSVSYVMLSNKALFNSGFIARIYEMLELDPSSVIPTWWSWTIWISVGTIILICISDSINGFLKARQSDH